MAPYSSPAALTRCGGPTDGILRRQWLRFRARCTHWSLDARLAAGIDPASEFVLVARAAQLLSQPHRRRLAASIGDGPPSWAPAVPVVRTQVVEARASLLFIAYLLRFADRLRPRGVAIVDRLLTDGGSALYLRSARGAVELQAQAALDHLVGARRATPEAWFSASYGKGGDLVGPSVT